MLWEAMSESVGDAISPHPNYRGPSRSAKAELPRWMGQGITHT